MNGFPDKMTDHQVLTNTTNIPINMGLQAHPCSNKRTIEGLEEPAGRSNYNQQQQQHQQPQQQQQHNNLGPRAAKQQCTIRVGVEAPDHLVANSSETSVPNNNWYHRDAVQQQPTTTTTTTTTTPDYETYVNGFNAAQVRASTPYSVSSSTNNSYYSATAENLPVPAVEYSYNSTTTTGSCNNNNNSSSSSSAETGYSTSSQNVYQNLTSMLPVTNGGGESLADRFERVCSSPRPYVQYNNVAPTREEPAAAAAGYHYGNNETARSDDRYWTFGYTSHCPKKSSPGYAKSNNYGYPDNNGFGHQKVGYQQHHQQQQQLATNTGQQTIQRDENGKSYLELGAKAAVQPEWVRPWPVQQQQQQQQQQHHHHHHHHQQQQQQHYISSVPAVVKSCSKCGHVLLNNSSRSLSQQPCYRHQRLSVLSLSMLKLNRYRQCSDPSLHRSVLICNTLRHIEDEMEREGLVCNPSAEVATSNCDTCCCSHCGTVFNNNNSSTPTAAKSDTSPAAYNNNNNNNNATTSSSSTSSNSTSNLSSNMNNNNAAVYDSTPDPNFANNSNNNSSSSSSTTGSSTTISTSTSNSSNNNNTSGSSSSDYNSSAAKTTTSVANADEDDSGFGDEDSRDIDWSSVFSMSTTSGFEVSGGSNSNGSSSDSYLCDSNSSDPSLFAGPGAELVNDLGPNWKSSHCGSSSSVGHSGSSSWTSDASDFSGVRWKSELGDELEGFVHILVGS